MTIIWLLPAAFLGLAALAVPILVHLLTRQERQPIAFPSLRFLAATRLVSMRQRRIHDPWLLLVRAAILALAVAALAGPLLITPHREREWSTRVARALVVVGSDDAQPSATASDEVRSAFASHVIPSPGRVADAVRSGVEWLATQPPAARELLIVGDLRAGAVVDADFADVPAYVGIRFLPDTATAPETLVAVPVMARENGRLVVDERRVRLDPNATIVERGPSAAAAAMPTHRLEVRAPADHQIAADAALAALLDEGIVADARDPRHVVVEWSGAGPQVSKPSSPQAFRLRSPDNGASYGGQARPRTQLSQASKPSSPQAFLPWMRRVIEHVGLDADTVEGALIVRVPGRPDGAPTVGLLREIASAAFDDPTSPQEPSRVPASDLARWSRPPGATPSDAVRQDEGDRRMLWGVALALLALEAVLRRSRGVPRHDEARDDTAPVEASRVA